MSKTSLPLAEVLGFEASDKRIDILRRIGEAGSISEAARGAGVSYKAAWQALETLANLAGTPLVEKAVGGSGGGGAVLTAAGLRVLQAAEAMAGARQQVLAALEHDSATGRAALALRTSMRNQFPCTVGRLQPHQGQVRVQLLLADGQAVHARITRESVQLLGLSPGLPVLALCKATALQVAARLAPTPSRNVLAGTVSRASRAASGGEVGLRLPGGVQLVGFAAAGHGLRAGQPAMAAVDEAGVVIAAAS
ncbi:MAG: TOBE domain-containing protein [Hylemonella sp.]|uniref:TOBE domain-containing protein n=1 Tax=Hylemonella sp. TaxID=2066020 RepID=UPI0022BD6E7D|nr:TOBE domain-containing protein [Hylemonella sp.]MCZ8250928.1 TOBE domain-containing protein [Hylemonella sp.]